MNPEFVAVQDEAMEISRDGSSDEDSFIEACKQCDEKYIESLMIRGLVTAGTANAMDKSGRTGVSHACEGGFLGVLELLADVPGLDINLPDKEGNTPLIFASQAGRAEVVKFMLETFSSIKIDQENSSGCTALIKAAIQGRSNIAKVLLDAGASSTQRDNTRQMNAKEWAHYCGRIVCAQTIAKHPSAQGYKNKTRSLKYQSHKDWAKNRQRSQSEPDLAAEEGVQEVQKRFCANGKEPVTIKQKLRKLFVKTPKNNNDCSRRPLATVARCVSTPLLPGLVSPPNAPSIFRREFVDERPIVVIPKVEITNHNNASKYEMGSTKF